MTCRDASSPASREKLIAQQKGRPSMARTHLIRLLSLAILAAAGLALAGPPVAEAAPATVSISGFEFRPPSVTITAGETVTWTNDEQGVSHTVSSDTPGVFDSGALLVRRR
jgi:plastocyanin